MSLAVYAYVHSIIFLASIFKNKPRRGFSDAINLI